MKPFLYHSADSNTDSSKAAIVLPEVFGLNPFIKATTDRLAKELGYNSFALDHFYSVTGTSQVYKYDDYETVLPIMQSETGEKFVDIFTTALQDITSKYPKVKTVTVLGFCFGGRLTILSGIDKRVNRIVSFYGAGAVKPGFYQSKSPVEALVGARSNDSNLKIVGLFGKDDDSISAADRQQLSDELNKAGIHYWEKVYDAGHAFMNYERDNLYNQKASEQAWPDVVQFLTD